MEGIKRFSEAVVRAEDGMEALAETQALGRWVTTLGKSVDLHVLVYDLLITEGPADARALAKRLNRKPKEVAKIMRDLHQLGRIEVFQISP